MDPDKYRGIRGMNSIKVHANVQSSRVYQLEDRIYGRRELHRFKAVTGNIVEYALKTLDKICTEEMRRGNSSPFLLEKYSLLNHYPDYLKRFCDGRV